MDLNKRDAAEFVADFVAVVQAAHRDASRETHALLTKTLMTMPPSPIIVMPKSDGPPPSGDPHFGKPTTT